MKLTEEKLKELLGKHAIVDKEYDIYYSHYHCWNQDKLPACGQKLEDHKQCCLCSTKYSPRKPQNAP